MQIKNHINSILFFIFLFNWNIYSQNINELIPYRKGDKWGYVNKEKEIIIPLIYDYVEVFKNGGSVKNVMLLFQDYIDK